ncbi:MAG: TonB-dependent receptor [Desulfotignum sp.]|nr:TonB-dependent receptor [Desulfotignum sp.]MCF8089926.1 TonB-dependent receptor [Desulfotignum sp.]MCF8138957.1 TonB-dependent receptor [Desulfotignum sp.]
MKKKGLYLGIIAVFWMMAITGVSARQAEDQAVTTMDQVVVSVTQTETTSAKIGGNSVTVITAKEIEEKNAHTVLELLKTVPGVFVTSTGGMGTSASVFIRGADSKNTLVMLDGIVLNDPSSANRSADLSDINLDQVERIEVVRGAMSVMYGSNATAGVVNIITKKGGKTPEITASVEGGSYGTWKTGAHASGATDKLTYAVSGSYLSRDGFSIADKDNPRIPQDGNTDEKDGYDNLTLSGNLGFELNDDFTLSSSLQYVDAQVDLDDYEGGYTGDNITSAWVPDPVTGAWVNTLVPNPDGPTSKRSESERLMGQVGINNWFARGRVESILSYKFTRSDLQAYDNDNLPWYDYQGATDEFSWQGNIDFENHVLSFGTGYFNEAMESLSSGVTDINTHTLSYWFQDQLFAGENLVLIAGARLDDHQSFGRKTTFRIAPAYEIFSTGTRFKASFGTGFRSPSLYELYSVYGNPDLEPEKSQGWDLGVEQGFLDDLLTLGVTYWEMDFENRIGYDMLISKYNQLDGVTETRGVEVSAAWTPLKDLFFNLNYTYTHTQDPEGNPLVRRPENQVGLTASYRFLGKWQVGMDARWVDERAASPYAMDKDGNAIGTLDDYTVVNLSGSCDISDRFQIFARVDNLFDNYYEDAFSYATPGLSGYIGLKWRLL